MTEPIAGVILAGGRGLRMGGRDKATVRLGGRTLIERAFSRMGPQCAPLLISANGDAARFGAFGCPVLADDVAGRPGPLAGILAGLERTAALDPALRWLVSVSVDTPFLPTSLVETLVRTCRDANTSVACAASGGRRHPVVALWPIEIRHDLRRALVERDERSVGAALALRPLIEVPWPTHPFDPFLNLNTPEDVAAAEDILRQHPSA